MGSHKTYHLAPRQNKGDIEQECLSCPYDCGTVWDGLAPRAINHFCDKIKKRIHVCPLCGRCVKTRGPNLGDHYYPAQGANGIAWCNSTKGCALHEPFSNPATNPAPILHALLLLLAHECGEPSVVD